MLNSFCRRYCRVFVSLILSHFLLIAEAQQPTGTGSVSTLPANVPAQLPINMTKQELDAKLNATEGAGQDMNKDFSKKLTKDTTKTDNDKRAIQGPKSTYGANIFASLPEFDISELSTPPLDYPIGVGDEIIIALYGGAEYQEKYNVAPDGSIFPKYMGKIYVNGLTFENARKLLYARFASVTPSGTNIDVMLGQPRSINVNVVNEVNNPGTITVSAFSSAFNVIAKAGGITSNGNLRKIQIKRYGKVIEELDIYEFLQSGYTGKRIYLQNNDFIIVPFYDKKVLATGQFRRPMYYQLKQNEGVKALLKYSGGLTADAIASNLKILRNENESQKQYDINATAILRIAGQDKELRDGDVVKANTIKPGIINKVEIRGEVKYPDTYQLREGDRLFDIIDRAGGITRQTLLDRAYIFRGAADTSVVKNSDKIEIDLRNINDGDYATNKNNVPLKTNDLIMLFSVQEYSDANYVEVYGEVRKPGRLSRYGSMTLQDLLYLSGGLKQTAEFGRIEISSIVDIDSAKQGLKPTRTTVANYSISSNLLLDSNAAKVFLKPYDQIFVRKNPTFELQQNIELRGMLKYPGLYPRLNKYEKLSSFIERAGGFKDNANLTGAVLIRNKTENLRESVIANPTYDSAGNFTGVAQASATSRYVSIDLAKALKYKNSKFDIVLQESDVIFVPEIDPFVSVAGTVQSPLKIAFDKEHTNVAYYIDKAGGFGVRPWRKRVYVTYANGKSRRTKNFLFFHFYPKVQEGCVVTIPRRPEGQEVTDVLKTTVSTLVPVIATALILKYIN
jgi:protein involved in polysaccharide export with SLBB domain